jgi:hypothetical protein
VVVVVKGSANDELSKVGLTEVSAYWIMMVKSIVVMKIQRSYRGLLLKVKMKVELMVRCDGQGKTGMRVMQNEGLVWSRNCVVNAVLLKSPATRNRHVKNKASSITHSC